MPGAQDPVFGSGCAGGHSGNDRASASGGKAGNSTCRCIKPQYAAGPRGGAPTGSAAAGYGGLAGGSRPIGNLQQRPPDRQPVFDLQPAARLPRLPGGGCCRGCGAAQTPAGIVFHISESAQAPFEASRNGVLKKIGESLLDYVQRQHAYNFVIDRFGRVHRVVRESDVAHHAGYLVWADERWIYVDLNESFLGVAFEGR